MTTKSQYAFGPEPDDSQYVLIPSRALCALIDNADQALDGDSNDIEHDALYYIREQLADFLWKGVGA
jgi:hypothetical protein